MVAFGIIAAHLILRNGKNQLILFCFQLFKGKKKYQQLF